MKNTRIYHLLWIALLGLFYSCKEAEPAAPKLFFSSPKNGGVIWGNSTIDLGNSPSNGDKISLFLNDSLVSILNQSPYTFQLNTKPLNEGTHKLTAVSSRTSDKAEIKVEVRNKLLTVSAASNQLKVGIRCFVFISNQEGVVLDSKEVKNGEKVSLVNESYQQDNFTLSEVYVAGSRTITIYSFQEVPRGIWTLLKDNSLPPAINTINVDFTDVSSKYYFISSSGDNGFLYETNSIELGISKNPTKLYVREYNNPVNHFKIIESVNSLGRQTVSLANTNTPLSIENVNVTGGNNKRGNVTLYGFPGNDRNEYYNLGVFFSKSNVIKIEYPNTSFPVYGSISFFKDDEITINSYQTAKKSDITQLKAEVVFKSSGSLTASVGTFGSIDIYNASWAYINEKTGTSAYWAMVGPPNKSQTIKLPELPPAVRDAAKNVSISDLQFSNTLEVSKFGIATDYQSYIKYISTNSLSSPYAFGNSWKEQVFTKSGSTNGRLENAETRSLSDQFFKK
jgi:hypothetical protein